MFIGGAILGLFGGGVGLSVGLQFVLHKLHIDSKKLAYSLIHLLSIAAAASVYIITNSHLSALPAYAGLVIAAQTVHRFMVDPVYTKYVVPFLQYQAGLKPAQTTVTVPAATPAADELA